jgi:hypothetical protein
LREENLLIKKILALGIIILFLGVGIQPAIATIEPETSDSDDDCNLCTKKVRKSHLVLLKSLLNRLEKYANQLSDISKQYPEFEDKYQELTEKITIFHEINKNLTQKADRIRNTINCEILGVILVALSTPYILLYFSFFNNRFLNIKLLLIPFITIMCIPAVIVLGIWLEYCYVGPTCIEL